MKKTIGCFLIVVLFLHPSMAQSHLDTLLTRLAKQNEDSVKANTLNEICVAYYYSQKQDKVVEYANKLKSLSERIGFKRGIGQAYFNFGAAISMKANTQEMLDDFQKALSIFENIGYKPGIEKATSRIGLYYNNKSDYAKAIEYDGRALAISQEIGDKHGIAINSTNLGNEYRDQGDYPKALEHYLRALQMDGDLHDSAGVELDYNSLNSVYAMTNDNAKAMEYARKALRLAQKLKDTVEIGSCLANIGIVYDNTHVSDSALYYELTAINDFKRINYTSGLYTVEGDIGNVFQEKGDFDNALKYYTEALSLAQTAEDKVCITRNLGNIGEVYKQKKDYPLAEKYLVQALEIANSINYEEAIKDFYVDLSGVYKNTNQWQKAYEAYVKATTANDSLISIAKSKQMGKLEAKAEYDKKFAVQQAEDDKRTALAAAESKRQNIVIFFSIAIAIIISLIAAIIFRSLRVVRKQKSLIEEQKAEVEEQTVLIKKQKDIVDHQKTIVEEKNKEITDSITYAKRLQDAILPPISEITKHLPDSFVIYKPKDIVAGDFYWMWSIGEEILIAACDCTGHGVPGAMVSVVCSNALDRAVKEFKITEPGKILDKVRELVIETFEKSENDVKDGMDVSLCKLNIKTCEVNWSGANNPLWYVQSGELKEIVADKQPIGKQEGWKQFTTHKLHLQKGDCLYLFTDGYADQFGGDKGKKYKYRQLSEKLVAISNSPMKEQKNKLETEFERWKGSLEQTDDVCMIGIKL